MTRFPTALLLCALASAAGAQPSAPELKTWPGLTERDWSPSALRLCRTDARSWSYLEGSGYVVGGRRPPLLIQAVHEVRAAQEYFSQHLGLAAQPQERSVILLIDDRAAWLKLAERSRLRPDGESLQVGREVYIYATETVRVGRVAHEMTHLLNRSMHRLPLWLDEGLALHWGWQAIHAAGLAPYMPRRLEPIPEADLLPLDLLTACVTYPETPRATLGFYREAEEAAITLGQRLGERGLAELACEIVHRSWNWRAALMARGMDDAAIKAWEAEVIQRCRESRVAP
jgi:hypothetical protein